LVVAVIVALIGAHQSPGVDSGLYRESLECRAEATARAAVADILSSHARRSHERPGAARHAAEQIVYEEAGRFSRLYRRERDTPTAGRKRIDR
jgi:hypothetical protein